MKCAYCGTTRRGEVRCINCGAPLPFICNNPNCEEFDDEYMIVFYTILIAVMFLVMFYALISLTPL